MISYAKIPPHMRDEARTWVEKGAPHPSLLGEFFRAVLLHDLIRSFAYADEVNAAAMKSWAQWLYNDAPSPSHGSAAQLEEWHSIGGLEGMIAKHRSAS